MNTRIIHMVERIPGSAAILAAFTWLSLDSRSCVAHDKSGAFMEAGAVDVVCAFTSGTLPERTKLFLDEATRVVKKPGLIFTVDIPPGHYGGDLCSIFDDRLEEDLAVYDRIKREEFGFCHKDFVSVQDYGSLDKILKTYGFIFGRKAIDYLRDHDKTTITWTIRIYFKHV